MPRMVRETTDADRDRPNTLVGNRVVTRLRPRAGGAAAVLVRVAGHGAEWLTVSPKPAERRRPRGLASAYGIVLSTKGGMPPVNPAIMIAA